MNAPAGSAVAQFRSNKEASRIHPAERSSALLSYNSAASQVGIRQANPQNIG